MAGPLFSPLYYYVAYTELIFKSAIGALNATACSVVDGIIWIHAFFKALSWIVVNEGNMS
jgi:hypothetical protein